MTPSIEAEWKQTQSQIVKCLIACLGLSCFFYFVIGRQDESEKKFETSQKILLQDPEFKRERHGKNSSYFVALQFVDDPMVYRIGGHDYNFLRHDDFKADIAAGDTLTLTTYLNDDNIVALEKNGKDYLDHERRVTNDLHTGKAIGILFLPQILLCIVLLCLKKHPTYTFDNKSHRRIPLPWVVVYLFIVTYILLKATIDFTFITNGEFVQ